MSVERLCCLSLAFDILYNHRFSSPHLPFFFYYTHSFNPTLTTSPDPPDGRIPVVLIPPVESGRTHTARLTRDVANGVVVVVEGHHPGLVSRMMVESRTGGVPQVATQVGEDLNGEVYVKPSLTLLNATVANLRRKLPRNVMKLQLMVPVLNVVLLPLITSVMVRR